MQTSRQQMGKKGEELAVSLLEDKSYQIVDRNWRFNRGELDIVALKDDMLVVVEVKTVRSSGHGEGEERISSAQQKKIIDTAYGYLEQHQQFAGRGVRFDAVIVNLSEYPPRLVHYEDAFWQNA